MVQAFRWLSAIALMIAVSGVPLAAQDRTAGGPVVRRTTLLVEDMDKSVDFYQRLGLQRWIDQTSQDTDAGGVVGTAELPLTAEPRRGRIVIMRGSDDEIGMVGLLHYERPPLASARSNLMGLGTGDIIMVIEVPDIQAVYGSLQQIGTRFHRTPMPYTAISAGGVQVSGRSMFVYDPDGHMIEVIQTDG